MCVDVNEMCFFLVRLSLLHLCDGHYPIRRPHVLRSLFRTAPSSFVHAYAISGFMHTQPKRYSISVCVRGFRLRAVVMDFYCRSHAYTENVSDIEMRCGFIDFGLTAEDKCVYGRKVIDVGFLFYR